MKENLYDDLYAEQLQTVGAWLAAVRSDKG